MAVPWRLPRLHPLKVESGELLHLDLLRFVASAGIVLCHSLEFYWPIPLRATPRDIGGSLALFVDVFFVISGFVITYVYKDRITTPAKYGMFIQRRVGRLYPLHILTLAVYFLVGLSLKIAGVSMSHPSSLNLGCLTKTALLIQTIVPCSEQPLNGVTWSLSAEMIMYLLFPLFLWLGGRLLWRSMLLTLVGSAIVVAYFGIDQPWQAHFSMGRALPAFLLGMTYYLARDRLRRIPRPRIGLAVSLMVFVLGAVLHFQNGVMVAIAYVAPAFAIAADAQGSQTPILRRFAPLGQLTYPLYMIHGLVIMVVINALGDKMLHLSTLPMLLLGLVAYGLLSVLSWISHDLFETPARKWIDALPIFSRTADRGRPAPDAK